MKEKGMKALQIREEKAERRESKKSVKGENDNKKEIETQILQSWSGNEKTHYRSDLNVYFPGVVVSISAVSY